MSRELEIRADQLVEHTTFVRTIARAILARDDLADDAVQDTFTAALRRAPRERSRLRAWLGGIARNKALEIRRREARRTARERDAAPVATSFEPQVLCQRADDGRRLIERVLDLPEPYRHVLLLRFHSGLPVRKVATLLDVPVETVRTRQRRALERLREALAANGNGKRDWRAALAPLALGAATSNLPAAAVGGVLMAKKIAAVAGAIVLLGGGAWWITRDDSSRDEPVQESARESTPIYEPPTPPAPGLMPQAAPPRTAAPASASAPAAAPAPRAASGPRKRYTGTLLDPGDRPVPDAWIEFVSAPTSGGSKPDVPRIVPDEQGRFAFVVPGAFGQASVRVHSETHVPRWGGRVQLVFPGRPAKLVLVRAVPLLVRVLDDVTSRPIADATVGAYGRLTRSPDALRQMKPKAEVRTNDDGRAKLRTKAGLGLLLVRADGYRAAMQADLDVPGKGADLTVRLGRGGVVNGRIVDEAGAPKVGVMIDATGFPSYSKRVVSDAEGRFTLRGTPLSIDPPAPVLRYHLRLWCNGTGPARYFRIEPPANPGGSVDTTLTWHDPRRLAGRVVHADGRPVADLSVTARPRRSVLLNWSAPPTKTDNDGRFRFENCLPGTVRVEARLDGPAGAAVASKIVELATTGSTPDVELVLPKTAPGSSPHLTVRLVTHEGKALQEGAVHWGVDRGRGGVNSVSAPVKNGVAKLEEGVRPGVLVWAEAPSHVPYAVRLSQNDVEAGHLELRFPDGAVEGRVQRLDGTGVKLTLRAMRIVAEDGVSFPKWLNGTASIPTDEKGRFRVQGLREEGTYKLGLSNMNWRLLGGYVPVRAGQRDVELVVGSQEELHDYFVEAQLMDGETNAPLKGWHLQLKLVRPGELAEAEPVSTLQAVTGSQSLFRTFFPVAPGEYDVVVPRIFGRREARASGIRVGKGHKRKRVTLTWERGLAITGQVVDVNGKPAAGVQVAASGHAVVVKDDGTYSLTGLDAGEVELKITGPFVDEQSQRVDVRDGEGGKADFEVSTGGAIRIVPASSVAPVRRLFVSARAEQDGAQATLDLTAKQYRVKQSNYKELYLPRLAPGRWQIDVDWDGKRVLSKVVQVDDRKITKVQVAGN